MCSLCCVHVVQDMSEDSALPGQEITPALRLVPTRAESRQPPFSAAFSADSTHSAHASIELMVASAPSGEIALFPSATEVTSQITLGYATCPTD